ncbi:hypothetical protein AVEN_58537-1 [Araneus ventricosus]|uniref:HTH psq-type domain-containing protein n=1 Tax=Araneus ventricosus TaxID=182803 RepID=A0A4Y2NK17_ARAVE|nr:hypothetical protein AVEN_58537-1 [Araneus ventricosus]
MAKRTKSSFTFKTDAIKKSEENPCTSKNALSEHFNVPESTLRGILKKSLGDNSSSSRMWNSVEEKKQNSKRILRMFWCYGLKKLVPRTFLLTLSFKGIRPYSCQRVLKGKTFLHHMDWLKNSKIGN